MILIAMIMYSGLYFLFFQKVIYYIFLIINLITNIFRLKDEKRVCDIIDKVQVYLEHLNIEAEVCRVYMRKIDHLYYKFDPLVLKQKKVKFSKT